MSDTKDYGDKTLATPTPRPVDPRARHAGCVTLEGPARIRRLQPEQIYAQLAHFKRAGVSLPLEEITTDGQRTELVLFLQRCLVGVATNRLAYPGRAGWIKLSVWPRNEILRLAQQAAELIQIQWEQLDLSDEFDIDGETVRLEGKQAFAVGVRLVSVMAVDEDGQPLFAGGDQVRWLECETQAIVELLPVVLRHAGLGAEAKTAAKNE